MSVNIRFDGKTVLITGATGDLGRVMVRIFAQSGADVIIHYHSNLKMAQQLQDEVIGLGQKALIVQADVTKQESVEQMKQTIERAFTLPQVVVNNAVIQYQWVDILEQSKADFISQFESCVMHNVYMAKSFIPNMKKNHYGRFIGINTERSMLCTPGSGAYTSAKRGMDGIYRVLAKEVGGFGITVNQIAPGWTISDRDRASGTEHPEEVEQQIPMKRRGDDQEVANAVVFLASEQASYITGTYLPVCGGNCMPTI